MPRPTRFVVVTEVEGFEPEYYGPFESEHEAKNWANTSVFVDFTIEPFDRNQMEETYRG